MSRYDDALRSARRARLGVLVLGCAGVGWMIDGWESAVFCVLFGLATVP